MRMTPFINGVFSSFYQGLMSNKNRISFAISQVIPSRKKAFYQPSLRVNINERVLREQGFSKTELLEKELEVIRRTAEGNGNGDEVILSGCGSHFLPQLMKLK